MNRQQIRDAVKSIVTRNFEGIDTRLNILIDTTTELFGNTITSIYDEEQWQRTFSNTDISNNIDNWVLPSNTKYLLDASIVNDLTSGKAIYYPVRIKSPLDWFQITSQVGWASTPDFNYAVDIPTFGGWNGSSSSRVDYSGIPRFCTRINNNVFVYPRPGNSEANYKFRLILAKKPEIMTDDTRTNTIATNYPQAMIHYVAALLWLAVLHDQARATPQLQIAALLLQAFASEQEISKLINIALTIGR